jgi:hypothetical protein
MGYGKGKGIVKQSPREDDISRVLAMQLQMEMSEADLDREGYVAQVHLEPEASPMVSISGDDDTDNTESDDEYESKCDSDVDRPMEDDMDALDDGNLDGDVDMETDSDNEAEKDELGADETK